MALTRRQFLKWAGATGIGAVVFNGCTVPDDEIRVQSPVLMPEDLVTGRDNHYATVVQGLSGSEGLLVRVMEGRAKKVEGNPDYPLNVGRHGARAEALLQSLYHPDRITAPLVRIGKGGPFRRIGWSEALDRLVKILRDTDSTKTILATAPARGQLATVMERFASGYGARLLGFDPLDHTVLRRSVKEVFGQEALPDYDLARTKFLLGFGADFLGSWLAPTHFSHGYGEFRQGERERGVFVQVDSRLSLTTAAADQWVYVNPGAEGLLSMAMAHTIVSEGLGDADAARALTGGRGAAALNAYRAGEVASATGVDAERIVRLGRVFADPKNRPALAIGGGSAGAHTNGLFNLNAIHSLNYLSGSVNRPGGIIFNSASRLSRVEAAPLREWRQALDGMRGGKIDLLIVRDANLLHGLPDPMDPAGAIRRVGTTVSLSAFLDETTAQADLILPVSTALEEWGSDTPDPGPGYATVAFQQPVVNPFHNSLGAGDVLLRVGRELGLERQLPWGTMRDAVRNAARTLHHTGRGSVRRGTFEEFWKRSLERGGWWDTTDTAGSAVPAPPVLPSSPQRPEFNGTAKDYPFYLVPFEAHATGAGQLAHLPWLQSLPDPITTITWQTWAEINPATAKRLDLKSDDVVLVESPTGRVIEAPIYVNPATPPEVIGVPFGQGHSQFTSFAANRGANVFHVLDPAEDKETGALAWAATRVRLTKTRRRQELSKLEGTEPAVQLSDEQIIEVMHLKRL